MNTIPTKSSTRRTMHKWYNSSFKVLRSLFTQFHLEFSTCEILWVHFLGEDFITINPKHRQLPLRSLEMLGQCLISLSLSFINCEMEMLLLVLFSHFTEIWSNCAHRLWVPNILLVREGEIACRRNAVAIAHDFMRPPQKEAEVVLKCQTSKEDQNSCIDPGRGVKALGHHKLTSLAPPSQQEALHHKGPRRKINGGGYIIEWPGTPLTV